MATYVMLLWMFGVVVALQAHTAAELLLEERITELERRGDGQDKLIASLLERLDSQDRHTQTQAQMLATQEDTIQEQAHTLEKQQIILQRHARESTKLRSTIRQQGVRIESQERALEILRISLAHQNPPTSDVDKGTERVLVTDDHTVDDTDNRTKRAAGEGKVYENQRTERWSSRTARIASANDKRLVMGVEGPVAFHAVITKSEVTNIGLNQNIVFDVVRENLGGGYHSQHGIFIAPVSGVYIFSVSITSYVNTHSEVQVFLKKDGVDLANVFAHGDSGREDQGSVTVVTSLNQGNEVWASLHHPSGTWILGSGFTSFMGCLVYQL